MPTKKIDLKRLLAKPAKKMPMHDEMEDEDEDLGLEYGEDDADLDDEELDPDLSIAEEAIAAVKAGDAQGFLDAIRALKE